jgi:hypothetical protein
LVIKKLDLDAPKRLDPNPDQKHFYFKGGGATQPIKTCQKYRAGKKSRIAFKSGLIIKVLWRREYTKKSGNRLVVSTRKNICKKSA